jgi:lactoylglutathione lyase
MRVNYVIVFVSDMKRSVAFYKDVVGLSLKFETPHWTEFATEGATLALHATKESASDDAGAERPGRWRSGFSVPNIDEFHERMVDNGVPCAQEPRELFGARIATYLDPDGLPFSVSDQRSG